MKLSQKTMIKLLAMANEMTRAELLERCDVPEYTLEAALRGDDIPPWEGQNIFDATNDWDGGAHE